MPVRIIELSGSGARFLCAHNAPDINSEVELRFTLPHSVRHEFRLKANIRHQYDVIDTTDQKTDYRHVVGVEFIGMDNDVQAALENSRL